VEEQGIVVEEKSAGLGGTHSGLEFLSVLISIVGMEQVSFNNRVQYNPDLFIASLIHCNTYIAG